MEYADGRLESKVLTSSDPYRVFPYSHQLHQACRAAEERMRNGTAADRFVRSRGLNTSLTGSGSSKDRTTKLDCQSLPLGQFRRIVALNYHDSPTRGLHHATYFHWRMTAGTL